MTAAVLRGHASNLPLPDASVDLVVTSPPYFGLRDYGYAGQIGSEATPGEWLEALWACTAEWVRVLKPEGSLFVNLGDKYASTSAGSKWHTAPLDGGRGRLPELNIQQASAPRVRPGLPDKCLMGLPWRYAIGCTDQLGLILRAEIVWAKPNGLPESVTDRVRRAHEQVFHFVRQPRYYAAVDEIREPTDDIGRKGKTMRAGPLTGNHGTAGHDGNGMRLAEVYNNPLGKLPGSVWEIPSAPLQVPARLGVDHFAAFPPALVRPIVLGWSPPGVCTACGHGRRPVSAVSYEPTQRTNNPGAIERNGDNHFSQSLRPFGRARSLPTITGYACACSRQERGDGQRSDAPDHRVPGWAVNGELPPTTPAVVLDPFGGTGTTALVASAYGRHGITVDLSADYCRLAAWRVNDPGERARARELPKPPPVPDGMEPLFTMEGT